MQHVLWLPRWYPNKLDRFAGDFIQRHAKAAALHYRVRVIHLVRDREGVLTKTVHRELTVTGNLEEEIIYYHSLQVKFSLVDKFISSYTYSRQYKKAIRDYLNAEGVPALCNIHVLEKNGYLALWLKKKYAVPIVISEQWVIYLKEAKPGFFNLPVIIQRLNRKVFREAKAVSVVSQYLGAAIAQLDLKKLFTIIPNLVDERVFYPATGSGDRNVTRFIHISTLNYQKNPEAILKALSLVKNQNPLFHAQIFGPSVPVLIQLSAELGLMDHVRFFTEVPQTELAKSLRDADALILYSRYETFGCVIIEANACGVPVIASDIPVHHETIVEGKNGFFAEGENPEALALVLLAFMERKSLQKSILAESTLQKYRMEKIGGMFKEFYERALRS